MHAARLRIDVAAQIAACQRHLPFLRLVVLLPLSTTRETGEDEAEMTFTCENWRGISPAIRCERDYEEEHLPVARRAG
jgi:hypothetical protein